MTESATENVADAALSQIQEIKDSSTDRSAASHKTELRRHESLCNHLQSLVEEYQQQIQKMKRQLRQETEEKIKAQHQANRYRLEFLNYKLSNGVDRGEIQALKARLSELENQSKNFNRKKKFSVQNEKSADVKVSGVKTTDVRGKGRNEVMGKCRIVPQKQKSQNKLPRRPNSGKSKSCTKAAMSSDKLSSGKKTQTISSKRPGSAKKTQTISSDRPGSAKKSQTISSDRPGSAKKTQTISSKRPASAKKTQPVSPNLDSKTKSHISRSRSEHQVKTFSGSKTLGRQISQTRPLLWRP